MAAEEVFAARFLHGETDAKVVQDAVGRWYGIRREGRLLAMVLGAGTEVMASDLLAEATIGGPE